MKKTYKKLPLPHKWLLASLVSIDEGKVVSLSYLEKVYTNYCSSMDGWPLFTDLMDELLEAFLKKNTITSTEYISWIHPSYRDLVIEEISNNNSISKRLLEFATLDIIKLSLSDAGGAKGERRLPLLSTDEQWNVLESRCMQLIDEITDKYSLTSLLTILRSSYSSASEQAIKGKIAKISMELLDKLRHKWNENSEIISPELLNAYWELCVIADKLLPSPDLDVSWESSISDFQEGLRSWQDDRYIKLLHLKLWIELLRIINSNEPRFLKLRLFPDKYRGMIDDFIKLAEEDLSFDLDSPMADQLNEFADELSDLAEMIVNLRDVLPLEFMKLQALADELKSKAESLKEEAAELDPGEPDIDYEGEYSSSDVGDQFNVNRLFDDL
jgi:hypothetical protein